MTCPTATVISQQTRATQLFRRFSLEAAERIYDTPVVRSTFSLSSHHSTSLGPATLPSPHNAFLLLCQPEEGQTVSCFGLVYPSPSTPPHEHLRADISQICTESLLFLAVGRSAARSSRLNSVNLKNITKAMSLEQQQECLPSILAVADVRLIGAV